MRSKVEKELIKDLAQILAEDLLSKVEALLEEKNITIPDVDRTSGAEDEARLYGQTYYDLEDQFTETILKYIGDETEDEDF